MPDDPNPFATRFVRPGALTYLLPADVTITELIARLEQHEWRGQILGPHGSGKSTLLHTLIPALEAAGRDVVRFALSQGQRKLPITSEQAAQWNAQTQVIVDGYEQLSRVYRWWLDRHCRRVKAGLLVTAHADVGLPTLLETQTSEQLAQAIVGQLVPYAQGLITREDVSRCYQEHAGNVRETLFSLYDLYQQRRAGQS